MTLRSLMAGAVALALLAPGVSSAQQTHRAHQPSAEDMADIRCVVIAYGLIASDDPTLQASGQSALLYFLGRIDGRGSDVDLETLIYTTSHTMTQAEQATESQRCGHALTLRGQALTAMGERLDARERANAATPHP